MPGSARRAPKWEWDEIVLACDLVAQGRWQQPSRRTEPGAKMHAKLAVADRCVLFVTSANLTQSGVGKNIAAGLLVRGGTAPLRAAEHVDALRAAGTLCRLS